MPEKRGYWYLVTGLGLGIALGIMYAWLISPLHYVNTSPASMRADFKDRYRSLIAVAYMADGDLGRARIRLALLNDADMVQALAAQAQRILAEGGATSEARSLAQLAAAMGKQPPNSGLTPTSNPVSPTVVVFSVTPPAPTLTTTPLPPTVTLTLTRTLTSTPGLTQILLTPTTTPTLTGTSLASISQTVSQTSPARLTPSPSPTPTATPGRPFVVKDRSQVCDPTRLKPLLQVQLDDASSHPVPGVEIVVSWQGGEDHFFTGLKPGNNLGYADFEMASGVIYALRISDGGQLVTEITPPQCTGQNGQTYWGGWSFRFMQP